MNVKGAMSEWKMYYWVAIPHSYFALPTALPSMVNTYDRGRAFAMPHS